MKRAYNKKTRYNLTKQHSETGDRTQERTSTQEEIPDITNHLIKLLNIPESWSHPFFSSNHFCDNKL